MPTGAASTNLSAYTDQQARNNQYRFVDNRGNMLHPNSQPGPLVDKATKDKTKNEHNPTTDISTGLRIDNTARNSGDTGHAPFRK
jgi:hypothetical protein